MAPTPFAEGMRESLRTLIDGLASIATPRGAAESIETAGVFDLARQSSTAT